ncbi:MAG: hypothetical protein ACRDZN_15645 [Acidimicrobiales bacterium]
MDGIEQGQWRAGEVVAWTDHDGVDRPPAGPGRLLQGTLAAALAGVFVGMMSTDTLCPEHRGWVMALGSVGIVAIVVVVVGLLRGWAVSSLLTMFVSVDGMAIGFIDAAHDATRGRLIALGFAVSAVLAALFAGKAARLAAWDRAVRRQFTGTTASMTQLAPTPPVQSGHGELPVDAPSADAEADLASAG